MFTRILLAIDGSDYSKQALPAAIEIATKFEGFVFVLHVSEHDRGRAVVFAIESPSDATQLVYDAVAMLREAGVGAGGEVHDVAAGHIAKDIVETARMRESDLIVMGSRGLSDVQGLLLGSVTHKVMQLSHIAVLVVRAADKVSVKETSRAAALEPVPAG